MTTQQASRGHNEGNSDDSHRSDGGRHRAAHPAGQWLHFLGFVPIDELLLLRHEILRDSQIVHKTFGHGNETLRRSNLSGTKDLSPPCHLAASLLLSRCYYLAAAISLQQPPDRRMASMKSMLPLRPLRLRLQSPARSASAEPQPSDGWVLAHCAARLYCYRRRHSLQNTSRSGRSAKDKNPLRTLVTLSATT